jgi:hypothetical protein
VELPPRQQVAFPASAYALVWQVIWMLKGRLTVVEGKHRHALTAGDRLELGAPSDCVFRNDSAQSCSYLVAQARR